MPSPRHVPGRTAARVSRRCGRTRIHGLALLVLLPGASWLPVWSQESPDALWEQSLRPAYFGQRAIEAGESVLVLDAPARAENAAIVPLHLSARIEQSAQRYIKKVTLIIDRNPAPLAGVFHFTPSSGRADLWLRVRVDAYTPVRAVAETNDGRLYMSRRFVKASGGCSAPVGTDLESAMARLGQMRLKPLEPAAPGRATLARLAVSHPNLTGLQMDQLTRLYTPAHFVKTVRVSQGGALVFSAETDISVSEDPNFRFYFVPSGGEDLVAEVTDSQGARFRSVYRLDD